MPPHTFGKKCFGLTLRVLVVFSLLVQSVQFAVAPGALAAPLAAAAAPLRQEPAEDDPPAADDDPPPSWDDGAPPAEDAGLPPITIDADAPLTEDPTVITPTLPLYLELRVDRFVMAPDETALLTVTVYSQVENDVTGLTLALALPPGLVTAEGESGEVRWPLPPLAPDPQGAPSWQQTLVLQTNLAAIGVEQATFVIEAIITAPEHEPLAAATLLGVAPPTTMTTNIQSTAGTVLRDAGRGLTLLVPPGAAPPGALFQYEPVYRADEATPTATPTPTLTPTVTPSATPPATLPATETVETVTPTVTPEPSPTPTVTTAPPLTEQATLESSNPATDEDGAEPPLSPTAEPDAPTPAYPTGDGAELEEAPPVAGAAITVTLTVTATTAPAEGELPTATLTVTTPVTPEVAGDIALYLPAVSGGETGQAAAVQLEATATTTVTVMLPDGELVPRLVDGVQVYHQWEFNAIHAGQPITRFAEAMVLLIDARWLVEAGLDPAELDLWTRATGDDEWVVEEATYDAGRQQYVARLAHFSGAAIGDGLSARGEILPTLTLFATDRGNGAATVRYPIEAPTGLGGQSPGLALTYSSSAVDDYLLLGGDDDYVNQAHWTGYGWNLSGISYIHRSEIGSSSSMGYYSIVLNGLRSHINGGRDPNAFIDHDYFTKIQPVEPGAGNGNFHGWTVTGADGTVYTFGGTVLNGNWPTTEASRDTPLSLHLRASQARVYDHWYLSEVRDRLGNRMTYHYDAYRGSIKNWSSCGTGFGNENDVWYTRSVLPREIRWSYTDSTASSYKMRVRFVYSGETRADYQVSGYDDSCKQPVYIRKKLTDLYVEAKENGTSNWLVLRRYGLSALEEGTPGYPCANQCAPSGELHLLLSTIGYYGKGGTGTPLHQQTFVYTTTLTIPGANAAMTTNNVRLQKANNGWNGSVEYRYEARLLSDTECNYNLVCTATNQGDERRYRFTVNRTTARDGRGNKLVTDYSYASPKMRGELYDGNLHAREFLGFETVLATSYATVAELQDPSTELRYEELRFHQALVSPNSAGNPVERDPRAGKQEFRTVWSEPTSACPGTPRCPLEHVYNNWNAQRRNMTTGAWYNWTNEQTGPYWVRLDHTNQWAGSVGKVTRYFYYTGSQNGYQYGNVTEVNEETHYETALDFNSWQNRVATNTQLTLRRKIVTQYYPNTSANIVNKPARVRILQADNTCVSEVRSVYDNVDGHYQAAPTNGILKKNEQALSACSSAQSIGQYDGAWAITRSAHDSYGNVITVNWVGGASDGSQNDITSTTYDSFYKLFPVEQAKTNLPAHLVNAGLAYKETGAYYGVNLSVGAGDTKYYWGGMAEHCAVNGVCTRQSYNAFGRPHHRWERVGSGAAWWANNDQNATASVRWGYSAPSGSQTALIVTEWRSPRCYGNFVRRHYNGLGQLIIEQRPDQSWQTNVDNCGGADQGQEIDTYYAYDALGRQTRISAPKLVSRSGYATRTGDWGVGYTATLYDRIDRPTQITTPSGENSYFSYAGRASHHYGRDRSKATNQSQAYKTLRWQELDEWGYLRYVRTYEYNGSAWGSAYAQVTLAHDVLGNLTTVTHPGSLGTTSMGYNLGGRKTILSDPDLGAWTYFYDRQHKLTKQIDARSKTICLYYDTLQRLQGKHLPSTSTCPSPGGYAVTYGYDESHGANNRSLGQLTSVWNSGVSPQRLYYDGKGRLERAEVTVVGNATVFTIRHFYDDYNRLTVLQYPDNSYVRQTYNSMGLPNVLCEATLSGGVFSCTNNVRMVDGSVTGGGIPNGVAYDHAGRVTQMRFPMGGNLWRTYTYAPFNQQDSQGGRLTTIQLGASPTGIEQMWLRYLYDSFGNVKTWYENYDGGVNTSTWNYTYDAHNRLTNGFGQNYAYDTAGRLTGYEGSSYGYLAAPAHAVNTVGGLDRYDYDANGNVTVRHKGLSTQQTLTWSHENRLASLTATGLSESYLYDDTGIRVKKVSGSTTTYYPFPHYEISNGVVTKYYFFNGQRVAMRQNGVLYYLHPEHLGGNLFATNTGGAKSSVQGYYAYGKTRWGNLQTDHRFTGQKYDNTGLYYFNARYYDPVIGTFISPDTLVPDPTNVWDYNRFMYARGNPLKYNDPTGHATSKPDWWPDFVPYIFDLPDGMTQAQVVEWLSENKIPTTWGMEVGGRANISPYVGLQESVELAYLFNWMSGEVMLVADRNAGGYAGLPDIGFGIYGGAVFVAGASHIDTSILGLSKYTMVNGEVEALGEVGDSGSWGRAVKNLGNEQVWVPGSHFIDPKLDRMVDPLSVNGTLGLDIASIPIQAPEVPFDAGMSHGVTYTGRLVSFNLYSPFQTVWQWLVGE